MNHIDEDEIKEVQRILPISSEYFERYVALGGNTEDIIEVSERKNIRRLSLADLPKHISNTLLLSVLSVKNGKYLSSAVHLNQSNDEKQMISVLTELDYEVYANVTDSGELAVGLPDHYSIYLSLYQPDFCIDNIDDFEFDEDFLGFLASTSVDNLNVDGRSIEFFPVKIPSIQGDVEDVAKVVDQKIDAAIAECDSMIKSSLLKAIKKHTQKTIPYNNPN